MNALQEWLMQALSKTHETPREASNAAGLSHGAISGYLNGARPAPNSCRKLAEHFGVPVSFVLSLAGHVDPPPAMTVFLTQMAQVTEGWSQEDRLRLLEVARRWPARNK